MHNSVMHNSVHNSGGMHDNPRGNKRAYEGLAGREADCRQVDCNDDAAPIVLTSQERIAMTRRASSGIFRSLVAQAIMACVAVLASWLVAGAAAAVSALIGAAAYFVPNAIFALRLLVGLWGSAGASPLTFFVGEAFKLGLAVLLLGLAGWFGRDWLVWPAMLFGLIFVLKGYVLLLLFRRMP